MLVAAVAALLGAQFPLVGAPVFGIVIGVAIAPLVRRAPVLLPGCAFAAKSLLQLSIVLLGAQLSLSQLARGGWASLPVMLGTLAVVLILAVTIGRAFGLRPELRRLIGVGTAICGGSAIAAVSTVVAADGADIAYALGTVFAFNIVAVLVFPALGHIMHMSQPAFGLWAGTAINDTSSVVAAAFAYGHDAGTSAVVVKLTRTLLIVPIVGFYAWRRAGALRAEGRAVPWVRILPWFILAFVAMAAANTFGLIPVAGQPGIRALALFTIVVALAGVGCCADVAKMRAAGFRPLLLGLILWVAISLTSLALARIPW